MPRSLLAWTCLALLLLAPLALAKDDDEDDNDERDVRKLELDVDDRKATLKLERALAGVEDAVKIEFDAEKAKVQVKHEEETETGEREQKLEARFLTLLEYVDADGDGAYDAGEEVASAWALGESEKDHGIRTNGTVRWGGIEVTDAASGNATGKKLSSRASFGPNATFGLDFFVYGQFTFLGNASLEPTEAKIDIVIQHYPYVRSGSALAVVVDLKAKEEFERDDAGEDEEGVFSEMTSGNLTFRLAFTWLETATVDGVERAVHATVLKNKEEAKGGEIEQRARVALSYPRGDLIVHDPTIGVSYETQGADVRAVPLPSLGVLAAVASFAALLRARRE